MLTEGRNREVRRLWESQGVQVSRLIRVRYGSIKLEQGLPQSGWGELTLEQVNYLRSLVQLPPEDRSFIDPNRSETRQKRYSRARRNQQRSRVQSGKAGAENKSPQADKKVNDRAPKTLVRKPKPKATGTKPRSKAVGKTRAGTR
jgi:23S rRNA pseudouridine2605 synthase